MSDLTKPLPRPRTTVPPAETPGVHGLMTLATGVVVVAALYVAREVLIPITLAVLLSFVLAPLVSLLHRLRLPRGPSVILAVLLALGVILGIGTFIGTQVAGLVNDVPRYATQVEHKIQSVQAAAIGKFAKFSRYLGPASGGGLQSPAGMESGGEAAGGADAGSRPVPVEVHQPAPSPLDLAERILQPTLAPIATLGIVLIVAIFILLQREDLRDRLIRLFGSRDLIRTTRAMDDAAKRLSRFFLTQLAINTLFGGIVAVGLYFIGVPSAGLWGIVATLMRFVPYVGSYLAAGLPLLLAAAIDPGWWLVLWTAALFLLGEAVMGQVVEPVAYGRTSGLSPIAVIVAAIFWGWLWGPVGLILAMPLTLCLVVLGRHVDRLEFLDVLLGDRPALTPVESFYQRILAGDVPETLDNAEQLLNSMSLSAYYDEVLLPGLQLAAVDTARGVLSDVQVERLRGSVETLTAELADEGDEEPHAARAGAGALGGAAAPSPAREQAAAIVPGAPPAAWQVAPAVLCAPARGPLDGTVAEILGQLLGKHGFGCHVLPPDWLISRTALAATNPADVRIVCISAVAISGTPLHLRYVVRRLAKRFPRAKILVGVWSSEFDDEQRLRSAISVDLYASSLRAAVNACFEEAQPEGPAPASGERVTANAA